MNFPSLKEIEIFFCQRTRELKWLHEHPTVFKIPSFSKGHRLLALSSLILMDSCEVYTCLKTCKLYLYVRQPKNSCFR